MNGGTFTEAGRVRPGVYANVIAQGINTVSYTHLTLPTKRT